MTYSYRDSSTAATTAAGGTAATFTGLQDIAAESMNKKAWTSTGLACIFPTLSVHKKNDFFYNLPNVRYIYLCNHWSYDLYFAQVERGDSPESIIAICNFHELDLSHEKIQNFDVTNYLMFYCVWNNKYSNTHWVSWWVKLGGWLQCIVVHEQGVVMASVMDDLK